MNSYDIFTNLNLNFSDYNYLMALSGILCGFVFASLVLFFVSRI
ncbi:MULTISPECIES: hypothetical protein [unclassified Campylobacter]|nr:MULTISPECIES: hypothetical protein [unclassified Campylobacter]MDA3050380.1 hypothetical protein [Campylobacter sp. JMF_02 ED1]MDA3054315.1 hypothetical protein [Campylobacter sp. VBCF_07 NA4]MDA3061007.1 hypothetical protein [Campylobacter sp. VBCF_02 NA5]MDA3070521.1 hypothetical protein [Campylobacter sp. VBCF_08 NA3]